jgi:hypothetical protein
LSGKWPVAGPLTAGIGQRPADVADDRGQQRPGGLAGHELGWARRDLPRLLAAQRVADRPQGHVEDLRAGADTLLDAEQHLEHHQRRQSAQAHLPALGDGGLGQLPVPLVGIWVGGDCGHRVHGGAATVFADPVVARATRRRCWTPNTPAAPTCDQGGHSPVGRPPLLDLTLKRYAVSHIGRTGGNAFEFRDAQFGEIPIIQANRRHLRPGAEIWHTT